MVIAFGYGIDISELTFKPDAAKVVIENYGDDELRSDFRDFCCDGGIDPADAVARVSAATDFAKEYEDPSSCESGLIALVTRCINRCESDREDIFSCNRFCIYYQSRVPMTEEDKAKMLTTEDVKTKLTTYLKPIVDEDLSFEFLTIYD